MTIDVDNSPADLIQTIFATLIVQGDQLDHFGVIPVPSILQGGTVFMPTNLTDFATGDVKVNSPSMFGVAGEVWIQAVAYAAVGGTTGTGPDIAAVRLLFLVTGASGSDELLFDLRLTARDAIAGPSRPTFSSAVINPIPEPNTILLLGLGLAGISSLRFRRSHFD